MNDIGKVSPKGYGLQIDEQKKDDIVKSLKDFIKAEVFESVQLKNGTMPDYDGKICSSKSVNEDRCQCLCKCRWF